MPLVKSLRELSQFSHKFFCTKIFPNRQATCAAGERRLGGDHHLRVPVPPAREVCTSLHNQTNRADAPDYL
ncbi:hypothetical protein COMA2_20257 [Candidatus Nitrospira nitrificans]|uniref:Uncharacterized protein n=1 Tax=Candidatus Nitrospira nitrificans TaxID=1742973 RepID=A0A0S4LFA6_9BACT|nr:hypothetical protein COMA2_20257 [Candidatus Nitrospira nitrificans]